jgi:hypothetical protein
MSDEKDDLALKAHFKEWGMVDFCPLCGCREFSIFHMTANLMADQKEYRDYPLLGVMCRDCTNIRWFVGTILGDPPR